MPREIRKRGKKHKKALPDTDHVPIVEPPVSRAPESQVDSADAPFGFVEPDLKAYFRTVDAKIQEWGSLSDGRQELEANEERQLFFRAALQEMTGKELQMATDPDCSVILERMLHSMDDFTRRVFMDSLTGSYALLSKHRFGSHVCQTCFELVQSTITREMIAHFPKLPADFDVKNLRTATRLVADAVQELLPSLNEMINDKFATHVLRRILVLLNPALRLRLGKESSDAPMRSKKSIKWKNKQGSFGSIFLPEDYATQTLDANWVAPHDWDGLDRKIVRRLATTLSDSEVRVIVVSPAGCPTLRLLLQAESSFDETEEKTLLNTILDLHQQLQESTASDFVRALIRDATGSHLMETIIEICPSTTLVNLWETYFCDQLPKLTTHPVSNFLVAKVISRLPVEQFRNLFVKLDGVWQRLVQAGRGGVLNAVVNRALVLKSEQADAIRMIKSAFNLDSSEMGGFILPVLNFRDAKQSCERISRQGEGISAFSHQPTIQGALLLQSVLRLDQPHNAELLASLLSLRFELILKLAQDPMSSRVLDVILDSETVPHADKKSLVLAFMGQYHVLVDNKIGSRVADRCWQFADLFLREKIAKSLLPSEKELLQSYYGKFFARSLDLPLLRRNPTAWRESQKQAQFEQQKNSSRPSADTTTNGDLKRRRVNAIDDLFQAKKRKTAS